MWLLSFLPDCLTSSRCFRSFSTTARSEAKEIVQVAWPLLLASLWSYLLTPVSIMFCGHLDGDGHKTTVLDGVSLAGSIINITGLSIVVGLSSACDTLFSQTYGSGNLKQLGVYLQRSIVIIALSIPPCWGVQLNAAPLLRLIAQPAEVSVVTADYLTWFMFGIPGCFAFILLSKYLQNQDILYPTLVIGFLGNLINVILHYILLNVLHLDYRASAVAQAASFNIMGLLTGGYIYFWKIHRRGDAWPGWTRAAFMQWGHFARLAIPSLIMICVESWTIEVGVFISGPLGVAQQSAQSVLFQIQTITDMLTIGFGTAAAIRIGQHLGRGDHAMAKTSAFLCIILTVSLAMVLTAFIAGLRDFIPLIFTSDHEVVEICTQLLPYVGLYVLVDAVAATCGGIVRGCGRQLIGSIVNIIGYYCIALPIGVPLTLIERKIDPLWYGLCIALAIDCIVYFILIWRTDWESQASLARERSFIDTTFNSVATITDLAAAEEDEVPELEGDDDEDEDGEDNDDAASTSTASTIAAMRAGRHISWAALSREQCHATAISTPYAYRRIFGPGAASRRSRGNTYSGGARSLRVSFAESFQSAPSATSSPKHGRPAATERSPLLAGRLGATEVVFGPANVPPLPLTEAEIEASSSDAEEEAAVKRKKSKEKSHKLAKFYIILARVLAIGISLGLLALALGLRIAVFPLQNFIDDINNSSNTSNITIQSNRTTTNDYMSSISI